MTTNGVYFLLGVVAWPFLRVFARGINTTVVEYRKRRFLKLVDIKFKDDYEKVAFVAVDTSDKRAMKRLASQLEERFDVDIDLPDEPH